MDYKMNDPWRTQSLLTSLQKGGYEGKVRLTNGENFSLTNETLVVDMYRAQCRCVTTHLVKSS